MTKISSFIKIYSGMTSTVNLRNEFINPKNNRDRMKGYKPIESHRKIFLKIARSMALPTENKVYLLVGHYGTGKSHFQLMLANYFSQTLAMPELKDFFDNFDLADRDISRQIQNLRGEGRYLVVIPDYDSQEDFNENLLKALEAAFKRECVDEEIDSIYKEAVRTISQWEKNENSGTDILYKFSAFEDALSKISGTYNTLKTLKNGLVNYERSALEIFKDIYYKLIGTSFRYNANNIVQILEEITQSETFTQRFKGIVFLYDEFDHTLKNRRISMEVVQQFAELCKNRNDILFLGSLHKELSSFAHIYSIEDFKTVQQRFKTIDMRTEGLEEIVTAIINVDKTNINFINQVEPNLPMIYNKISNIQSLGLFDWLKPDEIKTKIIDAVYPLHPLTMACLLKLSTNIGASNRTLFTFLGGESADENGQFSYRYFIDNFDILDKNGLLNLYTTDFLVDYFYKELDINSTDLRETIKKSVVAYHSSLKEFKKNQTNENMLFEIDNPIYIKILKLMLVYDIVGISSNESNFLFGFNMQLKEQKLLKSALNSLCQHKVIFYNRTANVYEFRRGLDIDWDNVISIEKERLINSGEIDVAKEFLSICKVPGQDQFLEAKKYNSAKATDMRLLRVFETVKNFAQNINNGTENEIDYFAYYENQLLRNKLWKENYDGIIIYVLTETMDEVREAKKLIKKNNSDYILVVIPENPIAIKDKFIDLKAALFVKNTEDYSTAPIADQSRLDESYIGDINKGYFKQYVDERTKYINGRLSIWYGKKGEIIENKPNNEQDPIFKFLNKLYYKFNQSNDIEFNSCHKLLTSNKRIILRDAINHLLESGHIIDIDTSFGNDKGFIRYLNNIFFNNQLLKRKDKKGTIVFCEIEKDISKYKDIFPALADMIVDLNDSENINIMQYINKYRQAPYGIGEVSIELFMAYVVKYFGDELCYKENPNEPGEISIQSFNQIEELINSPKPFAIFEKRKLDEIQKEFLIELYQYFSEKSIQVNFLPTLKSVVSEMNHWFDKLPQICRSEEFYTDKETKEFIQFMKALTPNDPYIFLFNRLQTVWGYDENDRLDNILKAKILGKVKTTKTMVKNKQIEVEEEIFNKFSEILGVEGKTFGNLEDSIKQWYNNLDSNQRNLSEKGHKPNSQPLIRYFKDTQNLRKILYEDLPACSDYGLGKVADWNTNNVPTYIYKIKDGLNIIKSLKVLVNIPIVQAKNAKSETKFKNETSIQYENKEEMQILVQVPENAQEVWISYKGEDPTNKNIQMEKIKSEKIIKPSKSNQVIKLVAVNEEGNFSQIFTLNLREEYGDNVKDTIFGFEINRPKDTKEAKIILKDLLRKIINDKNCDKNDLIKILKALAEELINED